MSGSYQARDSATGSRGDPARNSSPTGLTSDPTQCEFVAGDEIRLESTDDVVEDTRSTDQSAKRTSAVQLPRIDEQVLESSHSFVSPQAVGTTPRRGVDYLVLLINGVKVWRGFSYYGKRILVLRQL